MLGGEPTPDAVAQFAEDYERLLAKLADPELLNVALRRLEGQTTQEIAAASKVSTKTIERKLQLIRAIWSQRTPTMNPRATLDDPNLSVSELLQIDEACDRFEADWRDGRDPDLAAYLSEVPEEVRAPLFRNLLSLELEYRRRAGERPEPRWYHERFPDHVEDVDAAFRAKDTQLRSAGDTSSGDWRRGSARRRAAQ